MVKRGVALFVSDNSTIAVVKCLQVYKRSTATVGDIVLTVVRKEWYKRRLFRKQLFFAIIMTVPKVYRRAGDYYCRFRASSVLLLTETKEHLFAKRFFAPVLTEIRNSPNRELCVYTRWTI